MAVTSITVNGVPIEDYGVTLSKISGWLHGPAREIGSAAVVGRVGEVVVAQDLGAAPRDIQLSLYLSAASLAARRAALDTLWKALTGELEIATVENPARCVFARLAGQPEVVPVTTATFAIFPVIINLTLRCFDPLWYDVTPQVISGSASGSAVSFDASGSEKYRRIRILLNGGVTNPTLTLKSGAGVTLQTMRFTGTLTSAEYLEIDCDPDVSTIKKWSAGVGTDAMSWLNSADTFLTVDPLDLPTLEVSGTGASFIAYYYRAYWS